ncbi:secreted frizzled-related protein 4-like [Orbicella faveolata]|uniref:secreted frizzled-related protein 4-like n=1 Tax=Orbicella faveolata TaxID=48498 RepID=UPI0009E40451|nr:secreted frizzled-related protein 4-like [Orbicella faveolata]
MLYAWLLVMLAISFHTADGFRFDLPQKCEKISIPLCRRVLPYNLTRFPNAVGDQSQALANRSIELYRSLVQRANCSKHAVFFMCSFYLPICLPGIEEEKVIKPCRSLCKQIRTDCAEVIPVEAWEKVVKCEELPEFSDNVCVQPDSFVTVSKPTNRTGSSVFLRRQENGECRLEKNVERRGLKAKPEAYAIV